MNASKRFRRRSQRQRSLPLRHLRALRQPHRPAIVLICALVCLSVATALVVMTTRQSLDARRHGRVQWQLRQSEYLLAAGIRRAVAGLVGSGIDYSGETWQPAAALPRFETILVEIRVSPLADEPSSRQVTVLARLGQGESAAFRTQRSHTFTYSLPDQAQAPHPE